MEVPVRSKKGTFRFSTLAISALSQLILKDPAAFVLGGPPLITDDPGTPRDSNWEINVAFTLVKRRTGREYEGSLLDTNYGFGDRIQLGYEASEAIELLAKISGAADQDFDDDELVFNLGARCGLSENHTLLIAAGRNFRSSASSEPQFLLYAGLQVIS